jgi:hypothetical protein
MDPYEENATKASEDHDRQSCQQPTKDIHTLIPGTCEYVTKMAKKDFVDNI